MLLYSYVVSWTCSLSWILRFVEYIGYYITGSVLREIGIHVKNNTRQTADIIGKGLICLAWGLMIGVVALGVKVDNITNCSFVIIIATILQFSGFGLITFEKKNKVVIKIVEYSLIIYLVHPLLIETVTQLLVRIVKKIPSAGGIPLYTIIIVWSCIVLWNILECLFKKKILR